MIPQTDKQIRHQSQVADDVCRYLIRHPEVVEGSVVGREVQRDIDSLPVTKLADDHPMFDRLYR